VIGVVGLGAAIGSRILTNADICAHIPGLTEAQILKQTGIKRRFIALPGESVTPFAVKAAWQAIEMADIEPDDIDITVVCTFTGEKMFPPVSAGVHKELHMVGGQFYDISAACSGFITGLVSAADRMNSDPDLRYALVIGAELMSPLIDYTDYDTATYFSDGAGAIILGRKDTGFISSAFTSDTRDYELVACERGGKAHMEQLVTGKQAVAHLLPTVDRALSRAGWTYEDVDRFIWHQANEHLIEWFMKRMGLPMSRTFTNVAEVGNLGVASVPVALTEAKNRKLLHEGDKIVLASVGAGFGFGALCLTW
jgi:3-oxoacyl-[acyl-carrier-protein] synthase III